MYKEIQEQRLNTLINYFKNEQAYDIDLKKYSSFEDKKQLLRSLINMRLPKSVDTYILSIQDEYLKEETKNKGIVYLDDIKTIGEKYNICTKFADIISIWQGDITRLKVDAIVNAANSKMLGCFIPCHSCIDNVIHSFAGIQLRQECNYIMNKQSELHGGYYEEPTAQAMITPAYNLPSKYIIHTVGPIVRDILSTDLENDLKNCYNNILESAVQNNIKSIAICCISTGEFRFPNDIACKIALNQVYKFLNNTDYNFGRIIFNVFKDIDKLLYEENIINLK